MVDINDKELQKELRKGFTDGDKFSIESYSCYKCSYFLPKESILPDNFYCFAVDKEGEYIGEEDRFCGNCKAFIYRTSQIDDTEYRDRLNERSDING